ASFFFGYKATELTLEQPDPAKQLIGGFYEDLAVALPAYTSIKPALSKRKRISRPKFPKSILKLNLTGEYTKTALNERFMVLNKKNKIIVFASPPQLEVLSKSTQWYADGTFKSAAKFFYQLYILHSLINNIMVPCCFALMNRRRTRDYNVVLKSIEKAAKENNLVLKPQVIMTDFELAPINAFKSNYQGIRSLKADYKNNISYSQWFKTFCCLAIVPIEEVDDLFEKILENKTLNPKIDKILDYFVGTYLEGSFSLEMWNYFDTNGTPRTKNNLEGYNSKLNKHIGIFHPDIYRAFD
ncbi:unnamed protein product, partial [Brachionus calyciflorus]